ncbi:hypothetical protein Bca4012_019032 [Brassica carinata]
MSDKVKAETRTEMKSPERERPEEHQGDILPPPPRRRISVIMRGSHQASRIDATHNKEHGAKKDNLINNPVNHAPIAFNNLNIEGLDAPHNDPLVITLTIADCEMDIDESSFMPEANPLISFAGDTTILEGTVKLPIYVGSIRKTVKFMIVNKPIIYNAIVGTPGSAQ